MNFQEGSGCRKVVGSIPSDQEVIMGSKSGTRFCFFLFLSKVSLHKYLMGGNGVAKLIFLTKIDLKLRKL